METLNARVEQILDLVGKLRAENASLRGQLAQTRAGDIDCAAKGEEAKEKLAALLERLQEY
jgi:uncharacterized protein (TIGR02449 family)